MRELLFDLMNVNVFLRSLVFILCDTYLICDDSATVHILYAVPLYICVKHVILCLVNFDVVRYICCILTFPERETFSTMQ